MEWYKHHNQKIAEPLMQELLEKLGSNWSNSSWHNEWASSICCEFKEDNFCHIDIPNAKETNLDNEHLGEFYTYITNENGTHLKNKSSKTIDGIISKANQIIKEI